MNDMKTIVRLLAAIREAEKTPVWNPVYVSEKVIKASARDRDILAVKLQKSGLIQGLITADDIDNAPKNTVLWEQSNPSVTLAGIEYMENNDAFNKAAKEIGTATVSAISAAIEAKIAGMM